MGIVQHPKQVQKHLNLRGFKQIVPCSTGDGNARTQQRILINAHRRTGPEQNGNISRLDRSGAISIPHGNPGIQQRNDFCRNPCRFLLILIEIVCPLIAVLSGGILGRGQKIKRHMALLVHRVVRKTGIQAFVCAIVQLPHFPAHDAGERMVHRLQNFRAGTEVFRQNQLSRLTICRPLCGSIALIFLQKQRRFRLPKAIDGLLDVANQESVFIVSADNGGVNELLHPVGVLIFVYHDLRIPQPPGQHR